VFYRNIIIKLHGYRRVGSLEITLIEMARLWNELDNRVNCDRLILKKKIQKNKKKVNNLFLIKYLFYVSFGQIDHMIYSEKI